MLSGPEIVTKFAKKFVAKEKAHRGVLSGIRYHEGGAVTACNGILMLHVHVGHSFSEAITLDARTGAVVDGTYPDTSKLLDFADAVTITGIEPHLLSRVAASIIAATGTLVPIATIEMGEMGTVIQCKDEEIQVYSLLCHTAKPAAKVSLDAHHLLLASQVMKSAGFSCSMHITGEYKPVYFTDQNNSVTVLVMPYRISSRAI